MDRLEDVQYFGTACPSRASEIQAMMVLRSSDYILNRNLEIIRRNMTLLEAFVEDYSDLFTWVPPRAGAIDAIRFKGPLTSAELGNELAKAGIGIKPAYCFADDIEEEKDYFRVGFGESCVPQAIEALIQFVDERKEEWRASMKN
jgi:DNA-binding transcriptional MocR family regulator